MNILADEQLKMMEAGLSEEEYARRREAFLSLYYRLKLGGRQVYLGVGEEGNGGSFYLMEASGRSCIR